MSSVISLIGHGLIAIFGIFLSAGFCGVSVRKATLPKLLLATAVLLACQGLCYGFFGLKFTRWIYPLILHLPLVCYLALGYKKTWAVAAVGVLLAYLCCQIPRWIAAAMYLFTEDPLYRDILYGIAVPAVYGLLHAYAVKPVQKILLRSPVSVWAIGLLPLIYYIFDYATTVYTDALYSGNPYVAQIMPSVMSVGYIVFVLVYQSKLEEQDAADQERFLLSLQLRRSQAEYRSLCQMQEQANRFHHDLRHHTTLLMEYAEEGALSEIKAYLQELRQELDTVTFQRFSGHQVVDILLSHFDSQAKEAGVRLAVSADIPATLPFKDTELCSLLSNSLENAICACAKVQSETEKVVSISLSVRQRNLLLSVQNPYSGEVTVMNGMPVSKRSGHGLGTRSMASVVNQHGGMIHFAAEDGVFLLQASLPMDDVPRAEQEKPME